MLAALLALAAANLICLVLLLLRKQPAPATDPRLAQLPDHLTRLDARNDALDRHLRSELAQLRTGAADEARRTREAAAADFTSLRTEITATIAELSGLLQNGLNAFRSDNKTSDEVLRTAVQQNLDAIAQRLTYFIGEVNRNQMEAREALHSRLNELSGEANDQQEKLRFTVEDRLTKLNDANTAKLEEMRVTVDEKLHATLQTRLTESFGQVTTHLGEVQKGLGEMKELATGVGDLKRVLSNVKSRGVVGEFQLGQQLEQMFSPEQYIKNARIKPGTLESVEYALKFPSGDGQTGPDSYTLLAIDAKFPKEDWERLEHAQENGTPEEVAAAGRAFERGIRSEAKRICDKYIDPPTTMPHAIMFLPTENLYAEVVRRPGLQSEIQSSFRVTISGPSTFMAILTSFQMGFHTLAIQKKGDEVWRVLSSTKNEFEKFGGLMDKVKKQVDTVQNTLGDISGKTRTINRALKNVSSIDTGTPVSNLIGFEDIASVAPLLAASTDED
ncbi:DNA recombination protein RmuC [Tunturiibacter gelidoferens]|uniref:DNA recombination protein RmuC n=1 Tax=Tunturiibacter gelidiferens TaxID=3069689 RepID=A0ACC5P1V5_9BACT|nr:DNA recombination protein RmuC [Edaphobacter lichenicola]MBB5340834.1 DNA recombination protein RmuC [Edaphobacter lichenicola]